MNVTKKLKTRVCNRLLTFYKHHANEAKFIMKWKKNGAIHVKCDSTKYENESAKKSDAIAKVIVTVVKILKADGCTQDEILEPFKIAVAQEFGVTKEEYYRQKDRK